MVGRQLAAGGVVVFLGACASPTLPLPPPDEITSKVGSDADHVVLSGPCGGALANALIVIVNDNPLVPLDLRVGGARTSTCGSWDSTVYAHRGDPLEVTQQLDGTVSISTIVTAP